MSFKLKIFAESAPAEVVYGATDGATLPLTVNLLSVGLLNNLILLAMVFHLGKNCCFQLAVAEK